MIRLLFIGDVVGRSGRAAVLEQVPLLRARWELDFVVVNGENAAGGFGLTEAIFEDFLAVGVDAVTLGNHAFDQREALVFIERQPRLIRPVNFPAGTPGRGAAVVENAKGARLLVVNVMGRIFMDALDDPFAAIKRELALCPLGEGCDASIVDFHAEASSEKWAFGHFVDGKASLMVGHPYPYAERRSPHLGRRNRLHHRRRHDRRLQFGDRHGQGRALAPFHEQDSLRPVRAGVGAGDVVRRRAPRLARTAGQKPLRRSGSAAFSAPPNRISGPDRDARSNHCL